MTTLEKIVERLNSLIAQDSSIGATNRRIQQVEQDATAKITVSFADFEVFIVEFGDQLAMHLPILYDVDAKPIDDAREVAVDLVGLLQQETAGRTFEVVLIEA